MAAMLAWRLSLTIKTRSTHGDAHADETSTARHAAHVRYPVVESEACYITRPSERDRLVESSGVAPAPQRRSHVSRPSGKPILDEGRRHPRSTQDAVAVLLGASTAKHCILRPFGGVLLVAVPFPRNGLQPGLGNDPSARAGRSPQRTQYRFVQH